MRSFVVLGAGLVVVTSALALFIKCHPFQEEEKIAVRGEMSLRHIAERNSVPIDALIPLLPQERRTGRVATLLGLQEPVKNLGLARDSIISAIRTAQSEGFPAVDVLRYVLWSIWLLGAGCLLLRGRRVRRIRTLWLVATLAVFGLVLGAAPNPMEAVVKFHKLLQSIPGNPVVFVVLNLVIFTLFSLIGAKMLCSWGCQLGALQETLYNIPLFKSLKRRLKLPFAASIAVRITIYLIFFALFFELLNINQGGPGSILYHHLNMFKIYEFYDLALFTLLLIPFVLVASLVVFRPFCQLICPFGLYSWLLENVAVYRVRKVRTDRCIECHQCEKACPTDAMQAMNKGERRYFLPDCWSCGSCIDACPQGALEFTSARKILRRSPLRSGSQPERRGCVT
ncbi:MAG: 4Fe-4S binding protein [Phycisphaerae bacterium]|nr:4Fe-4S binding protein [Phycisphaerae bacterium]